MKKRLVISNPSPINELTPSIRASIILISKYAFAAENPKELSIKKGDVLKLLDRPGNGWILVKFVDKVASPGLVPSTYVDIAINDTIHPITLSWLHATGSGHEKGWNESNYLDLQVKQLLRSNSPLTINNRAYPVNCSISNCLSFDNRYWYRLDVTYSDHSQSYICRYYQDFYELHIALVQCKNLLAATSISDPKETIQLPKLPEPIPSTCIDDKHQLMSLLLKRCNDLHVYINKLILNKNYQTCETFMNWLDLDYRNLGGFSVDGPVDLTNDEINEKVLPESLNLFKDNKVKVNNTPELDRNSKSSRGSDLPQRTKSKNIYNHYQQITFIEHPKLPQSSPVLRVNTSVANGISKSSPKEFTKENRSTQESYNSTLVSVFSATERKSPAANWPDLDFSFSKRK